VARDPEPGRTRLNADPFTYRVTKDGRVRVDRGGRTVATVAGPDAERLVRKLAGASPDGVQDLLARATGNYRRGNEGR
jgi:hypothetical protein